jgi:hypothetical protein
MTLVVIDNVAMRSYRPVESYEDGEVEFALVYDATNVYHNELAAIRAFYRTITAPMACPQPILEGDFKLPSHRAWRPRVSTSCQYSASRL